MLGVEVVLDAEEEVADGVREGVRPEVEDEACEDATVADEEGSLEDVDGRGLADEDAEELAGG